MKNIDLNEAADMFEMVSHETHVFYNSETGEFGHYCENYDSEDTPERFDGEPWIAAPSHYDIDEYGMMANFAETVANPHKNELLSVALEGKGAFRRFKDTLHRVGLTEEWYSFKRLAYMELAKEWCEENGLDFEN